QSPNARTSGAGLAAIKKGIARNPVPGGRIKAQDFPRHRCSHLRAKTPDILLGLDDPLGYALGVICARGIPHIVRLLRPAITARSEQRSVLAEHQRTRSVRGV